MSLNKFKLIFIFLVFIIFAGGCAKNKNYPENYGEFIKSAAYTEKDEEDFRAPPATAAAETQETITKSDPEKTEAIITEAPSEAPTEPTTEPPYVITPSGKKYHYPTCRTAKNVKQRVSKEEAENMGYTPCGICKPK